jgi:argininosuccinate lyase
VARKKSAASSTWGGRFQTGAAERLRDYTESVSFDRELYRHDIAGSRAHAKMLARIGVLKPAELRDILAGLEEILAAIEAGKFSWRVELGTNPPLPRWREAPYRPQPQRSGGHRHATLA